MVTIFSASFSSLAKHVENTTAAQRIFGSTLAFDSSLFAGV